MKKSLLLLVVLFSMSIANAQKISVDKTEERGRFVMTSEISLYSKMFTAGGIGMSCIVSEKDTLYSITLLLNEGKITIDKGRVLLLKFENGEVIELKNSNQIDAGDFTYRNINGISSYLTYPEYEVTKEQIQRIIFGNVVKIRIEINLTEIDRDIKNNKFSNGVLKCYKLINSQISIQRDKYSDF